MSSTNPRNPNDRGADVRAVERLAADLGCIPADADRVLRDIAECERVIGSTIPESQYPDIDPELAADVAAFESPEKCRRRFGPRVPLMDLTDSEQVRDRVYAHDVADVALSCELGTARHTCTIQAHGRKFYGTGSTYGLAASDAMFRLRAWRDHCDERNDEACADDDETEI